MKIFAIVGLLVTTIVGNAFADIAIANNLTNYGLGYRSDAFASNGSYSGQSASGAQQFGTEDAFTLTSVEWWGSAYYGYDGPRTGLSNITGFQIAIWDSTFTNKVFEQNVALEGMQIVDTGFENFYGENIHKFRSELSFDLSAGDYFLNIGAYYDNPAGNWFIWAEGENSYDGFWVTSNNPSTGPWGNWVLPQWISATPGGAFILNAPSPGVAVLLGLAGLVGSRRRR